MEHGSTTARRLLDRNTGLCASQQSYVAPREPFDILVSQRPSLSFMAFLWLGGKAVLESSLPDSEHSRLPPGRGVVDLQNVTGLFIRSVQCRYGSTVSSSRRFAVLDW